MTHHVLHNRVRPDATETRAEHMSQVDDRPDDNDGSGHYRRAWRSAERCQRLQMRISQACHPLPRDSSSGCASTAINFGVRMISVIRLGELSAAPIRVRVSNKPN